MPERPELLRAFRASAGTVLALGSLAAVLNGLSGTENLAHEQTIINPLPEVAPAPPAAINVPEVAQPPTVEMNLPMETIAHRRRGHRRRHKSFTPPPITAEQVALLEQGGVSEEESSYAHYIFSQESGWGIGKISVKGCIGLGQNCRDAKGNYWLKQACPNWQIDSLCQIKRFDQYADERYKGWAKAYQHKIAYGWW